MRACEGCRRRKIRCDAATTNSWPCAACVRLKLQCVPPTVNYNRTHANAGNVSGLEKVLDFDNSSGGSGDEDYSQGAMGQNVFQLSSGVETISASHAPYSGSLGASYPPPYSDKVEGHSHYQYDSVPSIPLTTAESPYHSQTTFHLPSLNHVQLQDNSQWSQPQEDVPSAEGLSEALGELHIDETGKGTYTDRQRVRVALTRFQLPMSTIKRKLLPKHLRSKSTKLSGCQPFPLAQAPLCAYRQSLCPQMSRLWNILRSFFQIFTLMFRS